MSAVNRVLGESKIKQVEMLFSVLGFSFGIFGLMNALKFPKSQAAIAALFAGFLVVLIKIFASYVDDLKWRFKVGIDNGGDSALNGIWKADRRILLTHFSQEQPDPAYKAAVAAAAKNGKNITRLFMKQEGVDYTWLEEFDKLHDNADLEYTHIQKQYVPIPFNLIIVDDELVWMFFPSDSNALFFRRHVEFKSKVFATIAESVFNWLKDRLQNA